MTKKMTRREDLKTLGLALALSVDAYLDLLDAGWPKHSWPGYRCFALWLWNAILPAPAFE